MLRPFCAGKMPVKPNRKSIRLPYYDYTDVGAYFITLCVADHRCLFGEVREPEVVLNPMGQIALAMWEEIPVHFPQVQLDQFVVMPNHIHGILFITDKAQQVEQTHPQRTQHAASLRPMRAFGSLQSGSLGSMVRSYKSAVTRQVNLLKQTPGSLLWQKKYYEHVIRDEPDLNRIRDYILTNPSRWVEDKYYQP